MKKLLLALFLTILSIPAFADQRIMGILTVSGEVVKKNITVEAGGFYYGNGSKLTDISYSALAGVASTSAYATLAGSSSLDAIKWIDIDRCGFVNNSQTSITFDATTTTVYLNAPSTWEYFRTGVLNYIQGTKTVTLGSTAASDYYIYIDSDNGSLISSTVGWSLADTKIPVVVIDYNSTLTPKYWLIDERHTAKMDRKVHYYLHFTRGAQIMTLGALTGVPTAFPATSSNANNTFTVEASTLADEDLSVTIPSLLENQGATAKYTVFFRNTTTTYSWEASTMPYRFTAGNYIQWDNNGVMTTGSANYYTSYMIVTNISGEAGYVFINGRGNYTNLIAAQAEDPKNFDWTGFPIAEAVIAYKFIWKGGSSYAANGKVRMEVAPQTINANVVVGASASVPSHNNLGGLQSTNIDGDSNYYHLGTFEAGIFNGNNISTTGYITADSFRGDGSQITGLNIPTGGLTGIGSQGAVQLTGNVTIQAGAGSTVSQTGSDIVINITGNNPASFAPTSNYTWTGVNTFEGITLIKNLTGTIDATSLTVEANANIKGDIYTSTYTETNNTSVYTATNEGFSSLYYNYITSKRIGKTCFVNFSIRGVSNSNRCYFQVPYEMVLNGLSFGSTMAITRDNGTYKTTPGIAIIGYYNRDLVECFVDTAGVNGATWTTSGTKEVRGQFWYETQ